MASLGGSLARRYARAIFDASYSSGGDATTAAVTADLRALSEAIKSSAELRVVLESPAVTKDQRSAVLNGILIKMNASPTTNKIVAMLLGADRIANLPAISDELATLLAARSGAVTADIVSAQPLAADQMQRIVAGLEKISGKKVTARSTVDADVLGGVSVKMGDVVYDGTLRSQLRNLQSELGK